MKTNNPMIVEGTPVEDYRDQWGLLVKREDLSCPLPGPPFSKARGVYAHVGGRPEPVIGVLDTRHSQGGWAVARACQLLGKLAVVFYPEFKHEPTPPYREPQARAFGLGAQLVPLPAGRSAVLYHAAKMSLLGLECHLREHTYMMPNALKLPESVAETALEVERSADRLFDVGTVLVSASSATIAAGVLRGLSQISWEGELVVHLGYSRPERAVREYIDSYCRGIWRSDRIGVRVVDEGYAYADVAHRGPDPQWNCNKFYDLKAFRWWVAQGRAVHQEALLWNVG